MHESEPVLDTKYEIPYEQRRLAILQKLIPKGNGDKALDLGCGSGVISDMLRNHSWSVTAVDLHPGNVARAKEKGFLAIEGDVISAVRSFADARIMHSTLFQSSLLSPHAGCTIFPNCYRTRRGFHLRRLQVALSAAKLARIANQSDIRFCSGAVPSAEIAGGDTGATIKVVTLIL